MLNYIIRRLLLMIPTLIGITFIVFMLVALSPGGIGAALRAQGGNLQSQSAVAVQQAYLEDRYGLDAPPVVQYGRWLTRISPVKFGPRDLVAPDGSLVHPPKPLREPTLWRWYAEALPAEPAPAAADTGAPEEQRIARFRRADRAYADARGAMVAADALLREALRDYAREANIVGGIDRDDKIRPAVLARGEPVRSLASWAKVEERGKAAVAAFAAAGVARSELMGAFSSRPYRPVGVPVIPGVVHLAPPDFGTAFSRGRPVLDLISTALPVTLMLNMLAFPIAYAIAVPSGMLASAKRGSVFDVGLGGVLIAFWSFPTVLAGVLAVGFLANNQYLGWFPVGGLNSREAAGMTFLPSGSGETFQRGYLLDRLHHLGLPLLCLVYGQFAVLSKQTRAAMLENYNADYVRTAKAKGVASWDIMILHVFRNSLLPLITMFVSIFPAMLAGSVIIESIFNVPGMGRLIIEAINLRDRELILANATMIAMVNIMALLLADILYAMADPRVSYE